MRAVSLPGNLGVSTSSSSSSAGGIGGVGGGGDDLGGLVYSQHEDVPETGFSIQLRRYRALVRILNSGQLCCCGPDLFVFLPLFLPWAVLGDTIVAFDQR